jgi:thymidylate synthase (FAD)
MSAEDIIAYCARVSNPKNQANTKTAPKLIKFLIKHKHWSPFELANMCVEIKTSRAIAAQILRHRSFSFQEFSQRYANPTKDLDFVLREARLQDPENRQNSINIQDDEMQSKWNDFQNDVIDKAKIAYKWAVDNGIAKEQARVVLPEGNTVSRLYMNGTLRSWIHYIQLRASHGTQKEHIEIAKACALVITKIFPMADSL